MKEKEKLKHERQEREKLEKLEEEKAKAKLQISQKLQSMADKS